MKLPFADFSKTPVPAKRRLPSRSGAAFLLLVAAVAIVVMAFTQTALRGELMEKKDWNQRQLSKQLDTAIECTNGSIAARKSAKLLLPVNSGTGEEIEIIRDSKSVTARLIIGTTERDSLTRLVP
ncbi:hypothetical protein OAF37_02825 [Rubripirellula sp.]|nr:hypothetical protein [Rubripirellula sp.]MDB4393896.1 hypothetical protein [Rhodopirellula sp.]MDB4644972.1 hypothetical protein [Rubripirellula sp.]